MKSTKTIAPALLDNTARFTHAFFQDFTLREGPRAIRLPGDIEKRYKFPTLYGDVTCSVGVFMCDYDKAKALLPDPLMVPIRMTRGRAALTISNYVYRNVGGIAAYNEVAMTLPVMLDGARGAPLLPLVTANPAKGYYVFSMPVTSLENKLRGDEFWGLPKSVQDIDIDIDVVDRTCRTRSTDDDGKLFFELSVPTTGKLKHLREVGTVCSMLEGKLARSYTTFEGDFVVNTRLSALLARGATVNDGVADGIRLGDSPHAEVLRRLDVEAHPFQTRFAQSMNACFDLPYRVALAPTPTR